MQGTRRREPASRMDRGSSRPPGSRRGTGQGFMIEAFSNAESSHSILDLGAAVHWRHLNNSKRALFPASQLRLI